MAELIFFQAELAFWMNRVAGRARVFAAVQAEAAILGEVAVDRGGVVGQGEVVDQGEVELELAQAVADRMDFRFEYGAPSRWFRRPHWSGYRDNRDYLTW